MDTINRQMGEFLRNSPLEDKFLKNKDYNVYADWLLDHDRILESKYNIIIFPREQRRIYEILFDVGDILSEIRLLIYSNNKWYNYFIRYIKQTGTIPLCVFNFKYFAVISDNWIEQIKFINI